MSDQERERLVRMAKAYVAFLNAIPWTHDLVEEGVREGLNKFLSNAYLGSFPRHLKHKHRLTQLISVAALQRLKNKQKGGLVFEHVVPKRWLIQAPCEEQARKGELTVAFVLSLLEKYWILATITTEEDRLLTRGSMPGGWDGGDVRARYKMVGIDLQDNLNAVEGVPRYVIGGGAGRPTTG